jgi:hypothetical protein
MVDKEIDPRDLASIKRAVQRTVERMAHHLLSVQFSETRERMELTLNHNNFDLTPEQRAEASATGAYRQLMSLAAAAYSRDEGLIRVGKALSAASRFFQSNGMAYRLLEREQSTTAERRKKGAALIRNEEVLRRLTLWTAPMLTDSTAAIGTESMRCADRDALRDAAGMFFDSGVRCQWFEKMLLQALVAAEVHSTALEFRSNPVFAHGRVGLWRTFVWAWVFEKSKGESPKHEFLLWIGEALTNAATLAALVAVAWFSAEKLDTDDALWGYLGLLACGAVVLNWVARFITRRIVHWATPPNKLNLTGLGGIAWNLTLARSAILAEPISLQLARETLGRCAASGIAIDQMAYCLLDRAIAAGEFVWTGLGSDSYHGYDDWYDLLGSDAEDENAYEDESVSPQ